LTWCVCCDCVASCSNRLSRRSSNLFACHLVESNFRSTSMTCSKEEWNHWTCHLADSSSRSTLTTWKEWHRFTCHRTESNFHGTLLTCFKKNGTVRLTGACAGSNCLFRTVPLLCLCELVQQALGVPGLANTRMSPFWILLELRSKDDGGGGDNCSHKTRKAPVKSSPPTNQHPAFYRLIALPVAQPTVSKH